MNLVLGFALAPGRARDDASGADREAAIELLLQHAVNCKDPLPLAGPAFAPVWASLDLREFTELVAPALGRSLKRARAKFMPVALALVQNCPRLDLGAFALSSLVPAVVEELRLGGGGLAGSGSPEARLGTAVALLRALGHCLSDGEAACAVIASLGALLKRGLSQWSQRQVPGRRMPGRRVPGRSKPHLRPLFCRRSWTG